MSVNTDRKYITDSSESHWCLSSDTFDYKNDRFIFVLECPLSLPKVCHFVMGRSGKGLEPSSRYTQRGKESIWNSKVLISPFILESSAITGHCNDHRSKQPLNKAVETTAHHFLASSLWAQWLSLSLLTDFVSAFFFWRKKKNQVWKAFRVFVFLHCLPRSHALLNLASFWWQAESYLAAFPLMAITGAVSCACQGAMASPSREFVPVQSNCYLHISQGARIDKGWHVLNI